MKRLFYWAFLLPAVLIIALCLILPLFWMILPTFFDEGFTLANYGSFFKDGFYMSILVRSVRISLITTLICMIMGVPAAYYLSLQPDSRKGFLLALILFPLLTNAVVRGFAWINLLGRNGLINQLLLGVGIIKEPISLLYTEGAIIVGSVYLFLPMMISTLLSVMEQLDVHIVEASQSMGASPFQTFFKVILPLSFSGMIVGGVLVFAGTLSAYTTPSMLGGNQKLMLATLLYQQTNTLSNWAAAAMIAFVMIVISLLVMKIFNALAKRIDRRGILGV